MVIAGIAFVPLFLAIPAIVADLKPSPTQLLWMNDIYGFMVAGKFLRGSRRGGGEYVNAQERDRGHAAVVEMMEAVLALGGTITGEHGIGIAKRDFLPREQSSELLALQRRLKLAFDPDDLLNPGKILPS